MRERVEEEPEPEEEPDVDAPSAPGPGTLVPSVADGSREFEYRTELLTSAQVVDGATLAERLTSASTEGWELVDIVGAGDRHALLLRRAKRSGRQARQVGFTPPPS